jgi:osmotically-inducible protein OsmY
MIFSSRQAPTSSRPRWLSGGPCAAVALAAVLCASGCSTPDRRTAQERVADQAIAAQVEAALGADQGVYSQHIDIDARRGVVWLTGWVLSANEEKEAVRTSAAVPGVRRVVDGLEVKDYFPH